jgi:LEA14-like dessication related protein
LRKEKANRRRRLIWLVAGLTLVIIISVTAFQNYMNNTLDDALTKSLNTFQKVSVAYPLVEPDLIKINITFNLRNPTDFAMTVTAVTVSLSVDEIEIDTVSIPLDQSIPAKENGSFFIEYSVVNEAALNSIRNQTYKLGIEGSITASDSYLFVHDGRTKVFTFIETINGIP